MRLKNVTAAVLVAVGTSSALALAAPAQADPADPNDDQRSAQIDQTFLKAVRDQGLRLKSDAFALDLAHSTCDVLTRTGSVESALRHIKNATDWTSGKDVAAFGSFAVQGYCPSSMPKS